MTMMSMLAFLAQSVGDGDIPWWLAIALGPVGLTAYLLYSTHTLKKELRAERKENKALNDERRKDLVSGMVYREQQADKIIAHGQDQRHNMAKLVEAMKGLGDVLEKNNGTTDEVAKAVRNLEVQIAKIEGKVGNGGGSSTDLRP